MPPLLYSSQSCYAARGARRSVPELPDALVFLIRNFDRFRLPSTWLGSFQGQSRTTLDCFPEAVCIGIKTGMRDLATVVTSNRELFVAGVVVQARYIFPADLLLAPIPCAR